MCIRDRHYLKQHMNIHSSKYKCTECGKCFRSNNKLQYTDEVILERNRLNVLFAANDLHNQVPLLFIAEFTEERNHTNVQSVTRHLVSLQI